MKSEFHPESTIYTMPGSAVKVSGDKKAVILKIWIFKLLTESRFSVRSFFKNAREKVAKALPPLAAADGKRCSRKVSSVSFARSQSYAETLDSQRAEAIEDCIEFLNSSLKRSSSVSSSC